VSTSSCACDLTDCCMSVLIYIAAAIQQPFTKQRLVNNNTETVFCVGSVSSYEQGHLAQAARVGDLYSCST
jgi:hypothetical protein